MDFGVYSAQDSVTLSRRLSLTPLQHPGWDGCRPAESVPGAASRRRLPRGRGSHGPHATYNKRFEVRSSGGDFPCAAVEPPSSTCYANAGKELKLYNS